MEIKIPKRSVDISGALLFNLDINTIVTASVINILAADLFKYSLRIWNGLEFIKKTL